MTKASDRQIAWWYASGRQDAQDTPWEQRTEDAFADAFATACEEYRTKARTSRPSMRLAYRLFERDGSFAAFYNEQAVT